MGSQPLLTEPQWRKIARHLPESRRDRQMIEAILYREFSGQSLAEVSEAFGVTRVRLHQWEHAIAAELPSDHGGVEAQTGRLAGAQPRWQPAA